MSGRFCAARSCRRRAVGEAGDRGRRACGSTCPAGVEARGEPVQLTYLEFELLRTLATSPGPRFHAKSAPRRALGRLRLPRPADDRRPRPPPAREDRARSERAEFIFTVRGVGYRFREADEEAAPHQPQTSRSASSSSPSSQGARDRLPRRRPAARDPARRREDRSSWRGPSRRYARSSRGRRPGPSRSTSLASTPRRTKRA